MVSDLLVANQLHLAKGNLDDARRLAAASSRNAIYVCEQAAEQVILAVLTSEGKHGGVRHQLQQMVDMVPDENPLKPLLRAIEDLGVYATSYRYASAEGRIKPAPSAAQFDRFADAVEKALAAAVQAFGVDLSKPGNRASKPGPHRKA